MFLHLYIIHYHPLILHCLAKKKLFFRFKSANYSVMIWGCFSWSGLGTASQEFLNVLNDQVIPSMDFFFPDGSGIFQDDNAKIHRAVVVKVEHGDHECQGA